MKKAAFILSLCLALAALPTAVTASPGAPSNSVEVAKKKKKKKCKTGYKKTSKGCKKGPYKKGQTCSMSKQKEYAKYGLICLDLSTPGFPLTYLEAIKK